MTDDIDLSIRGLATIEQEEFRPQPVFPLDMFGADSIFNGYVSQRSSMPLPTVNEHTVSVPHYFSAEVCELCSAFELSGGCCSQQTLRLLWEVSFYLITVSMLGAIITGAVSFVSLSLVAGVLGLRRHVLLL